MLAAEGVRKDDNAVRDLLPSPCLGPGRVAVTRRHIMVKARFGLRAVKFSSTAPAIPPILLLLCVLLPLSRWRRTLVFEVLPSVPPLGCLSDLYVTFNMCRHYRCDTGPSRPSTLPVPGIYAPDSPTSSSTCNNSAPYLLFPCLTPAAGPLARHTGGRGGTLDDQTGSYAICSGVRRGA